MNALGFGLGIPFVRKMAAAAWTPPSGTDYPTAFSPTARGGVGTTFGIWADAGLLRTNHDATLAWCGVRAMSGIADGTKVAFQITVEGSTSEQGIGLGNASADLNTYTGADANGLVYFGHTGSIYYNGSEVQVLQTYAAGDVIVGEVDRVADTIRFKKNGTYVGTAYDISALGTGTLYPIDNQYRDTGSNTYDFGQTEFSITDGFTRGPLGSYGWWNDAAVVAAMADTWLASDTTRMWEVSTAPGVTAPNVVANDPVGAWYGVMYQRLALQSGAGSRPTYTAGGMRFDATGGTKQMEATLASTIAADAPFTVILRHALTSGRSIRSGLATSLSVMFSCVLWGYAGKEVAQCRSTATALAATDVRSDACLVVTYDGTNAYALDSDGNWAQITVGSATTTITHIVMRAVNTESTVDDLKVLQILSAAVTETQARDLQWSARNVL